jgi:Protein of unknown function (DUF4089)
MSEDEALDAYIEASLRLIGIEAAAEWRPAIKANLIATRKAAALVDEFPLPDDIDAAPVFEA